MNNTEKKNYKWIWWVVGIFYVICLLASISDALDPFTREEGRTTLKYLIGIPVVIWVMFVMLFGDR